MSSGWCWEEQLVNEFCGKSAQNTKLFLSGREGRRSSLPLENGVQNTVDISSTGELAQTWASLIDPKTFKNHNSKWGECFFQPDYACFQALLLEVFEHLKRFRQWLRLGGILSHSRLGKTCHHLPPLLQADSLRWEWCPFWAGHWQSLATAGLGALRPQKVFSKTAGSKAQAFSTGRRNPIITIQISIASLM